VKLIFSRSMVLNTPRVETFSMCTVPPRINVGSTFRPATWLIGATVR
jgi:hypothetical protein